MQTTFSGAKGEHVWTLKELNPDLPADWTAYEFLVLEFKASSSQRFDLGLKTSSGIFAKRIGPFAGVWVRAAIPLRFYRKPAGDGADLAATFWLVEPIPVPAPAIEVGRPVPAVTGATISQPDRNLTAAKSPPTVELGVPTLDRS